MTEMIGYGEDGLTLWALTHHLDEVLRRMGGSPDSSEVLVFYRPSFGRAGGPGSPLFGEFDAIVMTSARVFLIESKWDGSPVIIDNQVVLAPHQILRHRIFRWILMGWHRQRPTDWDAFRRGNEEGFEAEFGGKPMAPTGSSLARNLEYVLQRLTERGSKPVEDVVLYFKREGGLSPASVAHPGTYFRLTTMSYPTLGQSGFFVLG